jgi:hypothetical protein
MDIQSTRVLRLFCFPECYDETAHDNERTSEYDRHARNLPEANKINKLPNDKQSGDIKANNLPELERSKVERKPVSEQESRTGDHKSCARQSGMIVDCNSDQGVSAHFERGGKHQE